MKKQFLDTNLSNDALKIKVDDWAVKIDNRKNKENKLKITIKLNKEESEGFENFYAAVCPQGVSKEDFAKVIFFNGVEKLNEEFSQIASEYAKTMASQEEILDNIANLETEEKSDNDSD